MSFFSMSVDRIKLIRQPPFVMTSTLNVYKRVEVVGKIKITTIEVYDKLFPRFFMFFLIVFQ